MRIFTYPEAVLRQRAAPVENIDEELEKLAERMGQTMYSAPGIGLAANQVGELKRILVYDLSPRDKGPNLSVLINPEIVLAEGRIVHDEACLSVIDYSAPVTRHNKVKVRGVDLRGRPVDIDAEGLLAVCLQHEIDHLNGVLFIDHISSLKRSLYKKRLKKLLKESESAAESQ
ncbi:MAG: peptide deformylase [Deltaproteobacteria bacterium]|nr:peptide deformylase [Deltaproteobacteria bacterium]